MISISFIRHGATKANREYRYLGTTDEPLSREGKEQLAEKLQADRYGKPKIVFTSPMLRCRETADILFPQVKQIVIPEWTEIDFGAFEGKNYDNLNGNADYQAWIDSSGRSPFPGGESREEFVERVMKGFDRVLSCHVAKDDDDEMADTELAAVVHGGTIMALCSSFFGGEYFDYQVECGEGYRIIFTHCMGKAKNWGLKKL